jgi:membrane-associated phospholipid phosphatase
VIGAVPEPSKRQPQPYADSALLASIAIIGGVYVWMFARGDRFFISKTLVMPIFVLYGVFQRDRVAFLKDWLPLLAGTVLFDAMRGAIFMAEHWTGYPRFAVYPITLERLLFRTPAAPLVFQPGRTDALDIGAVAVHGSHFAFFLLFGLILWHLRREYFPHFRYAMLLVMGIGLIGYAVVPTVPPWMAFRDFHLLPPIERVAGQVYTSFVPELYGTFDTNPVAAMPSLHAAFPFTCALIGWKVYGRAIGLGLVLYAIAVMTSVMYLGEHYAVDVIAGALVAWGAVYLSGRKPAPVWTLPQSVTISAGGVALTFFLLWAYR